MVGCVLQRKGRAALDAQAVEDFGNRPYSPPAHRELSQCRVMRRLVEFRAPVFDDNRAVPAISRITSGRFDARAGGRARDDKTLDS